MTIELASTALVVITFNVLDSVSTHLCFKQYPDKELKAEANPIMRWLMRKNKALAEIFKQVGVLSVVIYLIFSDSPETIRLLAIMLGIVVLNNTYIYVSRAITKRKVITPISKLFTFLRIPKFFSYILILFIIICLSVWIYSLIW